MARNQQPLGVMSQRQPRRVRVWRRGNRAVVALLLLGGSLHGCGARSELKEDAPPPAPLAALDLCETPGETRPCKTACGVGIETCQGGLFDGCTAPVPLAPPATITVPGIVHDLHSSHPDFEKFLDDDRGIVKNHLGEDGKPVYAGNPTTPTTTGAESFQAWFHDIPGVSTSAPLPLALTRSAGLAYVFDSQAFFPIDDQLFGNEGRAHNFHFTYEMHSKFLYRGGERLTFSGDDDVFVFLNDQKVIDLGGVHSTEQQTVSLDAVAKGLGMEQGKIYAFDLFFAERHTDGSTFHLETTVAVFDPCPP